MHILDDLIKQSFESYKKGNTSVCEENKFFEELYSFDRSLICKLYDELVKTEDDIDNWDEDFITRSLVYAIKSNLKHRFNIDIWKQSGNDEQNFGDIAFVVVFHLSNGSTFIGVSFIEAKRDYQEHNHKFISFKKDQMNRFLQHTTSSFYLFYSHSSFLPILETQLLKQYVEAKNIDDGQLKLDDIEVTKTTTLPTQLNRFLNGFDLDFSKEMIQVASGNGKMKPKIIIKADVHGPGFEPTPTPGQTPPFNPNPDVFKKFTEDDLKQKDENKKKKSSERNNYIKRRGP